MPKLRDLAFRPSRIGGGEIAEVVTKRGTLVIQRGGLLSSATETAFVVSGALDFPSEEEVDRLLAVIDAEVQ